MTGKIEGKCPGSSQKQRGSFAASHGLKGDSYLLQKHVAELEKFCCPCHCQYKHLGDHTLL